MKEPGPEIYAKLQKAQAGFGSITKDAKGNYSNYATLDSILSKVTPVLHAAGLVAFHQMHHSDGNVVHISAVLADVETGSVIECTLSIPLEKMTAQSAGSAITYGRRYTLLAVLGIAPEDDDDGQAASQPKAKPKAKTQEKPQEKPYLGTLGLTDDEKQALASECGSKGVPLKVFAEKAKELGIDNYVDLSSLLAGWS